MSRVSSFSLRQHQLASAVPLSLGSALGRRLVDSGHLGYGDDRSSDGATSIGLSSGCRRFAAGEVCKPFGSFAASRALAGAPGKLLRANRLRARMHLALDACRFSVAS